ncbi:hypothetical protein QBC38DRAFT_477675 [Podospora fimiseda]|uniref:Coenzyme Q-binding protein COQ10 START domain-containing protein n=1 Tax=Podospora fimiseda TaxID=252190 RepID=A0AAN7BQ67_9PEZI|nr:hypothetical protein QBC38DRAFT_477675 [Podospora fimiseda]
MSSPPIRSGAEKAYIEILTEQPVPTPTYGSGGSFTIACSTRIAAPPSTVFDIVIDASKYSTWNQFCPKCTIDHQPDFDDNDNDNEKKLKQGTKFTFDVVLDPKSGSARPTALIVNVLEPIEYEGGKRKGWRITWGPRPSFFMPEWLLRSERVQEFIEIPGSNDTEYLCWETFYGPLAPVVRMTVGNQVQNGFRLGMEGLKKRAEEK